MPIPSRTGISSEALAVLLHQKIQELPGQLNNQELAEKLGENPTRVGRILAKLEEARLIRRMNSKKWIDTEPLDVHCVKTANTG